MSTLADQARRLEKGYAPHDDKPLGGYVMLMGVFCTTAATFAGWFRRSGRELPDAMGGRDLVLLSIASQKASRMLTKDRVTSPIRAPFTRYEHDAGPGEASEKARGGRVRAAVGELLTCPYCLAMWTSAGLTAGLLVAPRFTRWASSVLVILFGSDMLQIAYKKAQDTL